MGLAITVETRLKGLVPKRLRPFVRRLYCLAADSLGRLRTQDDLVPPKRLLRFSTDPATDFRQTGSGFRDFLIANCGLQPSHGVLDIGCGVGRLAVALTEYLDRAGRYEGFDVIPEEIAWCDARISPAFPNFRFRLAGVYNRAYNPAGTIRAADFTFPYPAASFDLAVSASVFTHMLPRDVERYLTEMTRVLRPAARCFTSFYLLNEVSRRNIAAGTSAFDFAEEIEGCRVQDAGNAELAVAHEETWVRALFARCGLAIDAVMPGTWSVSAEQSQDIIVASKLV